MANKILDMPKGFSAAESSLQLFGDLTELWKAILQSEHREFLLTHTLSILIEHFTFSEEALHPIDIANLAVTDASVQELEELHTNSIGLLH